MVLYVLTLVMAMLEAYGLRLRRVVAAYYYPARERQRAVWLYNTILLTRGAFFKFTRRQLRRKFKNDTEIQVGCRSSNSFLGSALCSYLHHSIIAWLPLFTVRTRTHKHKHT